MTAAATDIKTIITLTTAGLLAGNYQHADLENHQGVSYPVAAQEILNVDHSGTIVLADSMVQQRPGFAERHETQVNGPPVKVDIHQEGQHQTLIVSVDQATSPGVTPHKHHSRGPPGNKAQQQGKKEPTHWIPPSYL